MAGFTAGIDIGSKYTKALLLDHRKVLEAHLFPTPVAQAIDGAKRIDEEKFVARLNEALPLQKLSRVKIGVNMPAFSITVLSVFLPPMPKKELFFAGLNEARQKMIPVSGPGHVFESLYLGEATVNKASRSEVLVIRSEKSHVERVLGVMRAAQVNPVLLSPTSTLLPLLLKKETWKKDAASCILDIGATGMKICICRDENMTFMREIVYGLDDIAQDISHQLGIDSKKTESILLSKGIPAIAFDPKNKIANAEEVMRQKYEAGLMEVGAQSEQVNELELRMLWQPHLERIGQELRRSFVFYKDMPESRPITSLYLAGGASAIPGFLKPLSEIVNMETQLLLPFSQQQVANDSPLKEVLLSTSLFSGAAALAMGVPLSKAAQERGVNFLPLEIKQREAVAAQRLAAVIVSASVVVVLALLSLNQFVVNVSLRNKMKHEERNLESVKPVATRLKELVEMKNGVTQKSSLIEEITAARPDLQAYMKDLVAAVPQSVLFMECSLSASRLEIRAAVTADFEEAQRLISRFVSAISGLAYLTNVSATELVLEELRASPDGRGPLTEVKMREFAVTADVAKPSQ